MPVHLRHRLQTPRVSWVFFGIHSCFYSTCITTIDCAMTRIIDFAAPVGQKAGPGRWNDLDMLEIGNGGMNFDEYGRS